MKTLEQIKNEYAKSIGYKNWHDLVVSDAIEGEFNMSHHYEHLLILVQKEQQKIIAENVDLKFQLNALNVYDWSVDKSSIINDKNIIK